MNARPEGWPLSWMFWHPHQRLWNAGLVGAIERTIPISAINRPIRGMIMLIDTFFLFVRAVARRSSLLGVRRIFAKARARDGVRIIYFDVGTHKEGAELAAMTDAILPRMGSDFEAFGFEASQESFHQVNQKFLGNRHVSVVHKALCNATPPQGKIRLYHDAAGGLGDSLHRPGDSFEDVEAARFSDWLRERNIALEDRICLLRMNIEGAEYDVLQDLVENGLAAHVDGYYGMWDDISKTDIPRDAEFRAFLSSNGIRSCTFNGRDMRWRVRLKCIEYDLNTSVLAGLRRLERRSGAAGGRVGPAS
jgi:FkbM family methyltransferase